MEALTSLKARLIHIRAARTLEQAIQEYQGEGNVLFVQPNYIYHAVEKIPNDSFFASTQWAMKNTGQTINGTVGTPGADIKATLAWDITIGSTSVVVGVVDTGVDYNHPDLAANIWSNPGNIGLGTLGSHGYNAITSSYDPMDDNGHGTHVSGTIGAVGNNSIGVAGINWTTAIMGLKFLDATGSGTTANAIKAIDFAVQAKIKGVNVRVINASWGGGGPDASLLAEIQKANANDILFVAAAGNNGTDNDVSPFYPANYSVAANTHVITVAATDNNDLLASFSNYGLNSVQIGAPGVNIASTWPGNQYYWANGTSMATPHVVGAAALILSYRPTLAVADLKAAILNHVDTIPSLSGKTVTGGRLNVYKALTVAPPPPTPDYSLSITPGSQTVTQGAATTYNVTVGSLNGFSEDVTLSVSGLPGGATYSLPSVTGGGSSTLTITTAAGTASSTYPLTVTGTSGALIHSASASLVVAAADFSLSASPTSRTIQTGHSTTYTFTITPSGGFTGAVALSASGLPSGATATFKPSSVTTSGKSTLTITTRSTTPKGTYKLTVTGTSGTLSHGATVTLIVR